MRENAGGKVCQGSFQGKEHSTGFIGSTDGISFSIGPIVQDKSDLYGGGSFWECLGVAWVKGREGVTERGDRGWGGARFWWR